MNALSIATAGIHSASARFAASALRTAANPRDNLAEESVDRLTAEIALKANVAVIRTADDMTGTLLDILS